MSQTKQRFAIGLVILVQLILIITFAIQKQGYFIDEIFSYLLSNSYFKPTPTFELYDKWTEPEYFSDLVVVSENHRFAYDSVFYNQSRDVHPPLYYVILHTICSFFPNTFSKWYGLSINIVLFIVCNLVLISISKRIFENQYLALLPSIIWGLSAGAISTVIFIRMYMLLTTISVIFVYLNFLYVKEERSIGLLLGIFLITLLGVLTHYYFLIFAFFEASMLFLFWVIRKKWRPLIRHTTILLISIATGIIIFPSLIFQIFNSYRGNDAIKGFTNIPDYFHRITTMLAAMSLQQFAGLLEEMLIFFTGIILLRLIFQWIPKLSKLDQSIRKPVLAQKFTPSLHLMKEFFARNVFVLSLTISAIASFITLAIISPYLDVRYLYYIYPIISLLAVFFLYRINSLMTKNHRLAVSGVFIIFFIFNILSFKNGQVEHLNYGYSETLSIAQQYSNHDCIYISINPSMINSNIVELSKFQKIYILKPENIKFLSDILKSTATERGVIFYFDIYIGNQDQLLKDVIANTQFSQIEFLYSTDFANTYLIY